MACLLVQERPEGNDGPGKGCQGQEQERRNQRVEVVALADLTSQSLCYPQVEEGDEDGNVQEGDLFGSKAEGQEPGSDVQVAVAALFDVAPGQITSPSVHKPM